LAFTFALQSLNYTSWSYATHRKPQNTTFYSLNVPTRV